MFERYYRELLNFISRSLGDREEAADVVQETFARVLSLPAELSPPLANASSEVGNGVRDPRALLYRTARNILIDRHRRILVRDHDDIESLELLAPASCEPDAALASRRRTDMLLAAIENLPPRCKEAFVLHRFEGVSHAEIAERMGISRNMVEKHVINAVLSCKRCLDAFEQGDVRE